MTHPSQREVLDAIRAETAKMPSVDHNGTIVMTHDQRETERAQAQRLQEIRDQHTADAAERAAQLRVAYELEGVPAEPARRAPQPNVAQGAGFVAPPGVPSGTQRLEQAALLGDTQAKIALLNRNLGLAQPGRAEWADYGSQMPLTPPPPSAA